MSSEIATMRRSLAPTTYAEAFEFAQHLAKSSMVPAEYKGKPENILLAMQWGMEVGLAPLQAIQNIAVINGKPSVYGDALLAMVKGSPVCDDVIERFEGTGETLTAVCEARRVGKAPVFARFGVAEAKLAHLWGKTGPWAQYPRRMLQMRARGFALRDAFPDVLRGVITAEEATDYPVDVGKPREMLDVTPKSDLDRFAGEDGMPAGDDALRIAAEQTAMSGTAAFREWWKTLDAGQRDALRPDIGEYQRVAGEADAQPGTTFVVIDADGEEREYTTAMATAEAVALIFADAAKRGQAALDATAENNAAAIDQLREVGHGPIAESLNERWQELATGLDPFGLPPDGAGMPGSAAPAPKTEQPRPGAPAERPGASAPADSPTRQGEPSPPQRDPLVVPLERRPTTEQLEYYARQLLALIAEEPLTAQRAALIKRANEGGIGYLKLKLVERYDEVMAALNAKVEAV